MTTRGALSLEERTRLRPQLSVRGAHAPRVVVYAPRINELSKFGKHRLPGCWYRMLAETHFNSLVVQVLNLRLRNLQSCATYKLC